MSGVLISTIDTFATVNPDYLLLKPGKSSQSSRKPLEDPVLNLLSPWENTVFPEHSVYLAL